MLDVSEWEVGLLKYSIMRVEMLQMIFFSNSKIHKQFITVSSIQCPVISAEIRLKLR